MVKDQEGDQTARHCVRQQRVSLICVGANIAFVALAYALRSLGSTTLLMIMVAIALGSVGLLYYSTPRRKNVLVAKRSPDLKEIKTTSKVVTLAQEAVSADHN